MLAWEPFVPAVTAPQLKLVSVLAVSQRHAGSWRERVHRNRSSRRNRHDDGRAAVLLRLRLIAAARLAALVATVLDTSKSSPVFVVFDAVRVRVTAVPPVGVMVIDVVWPDVGSPVKVPTTLARVFPVDALTGNTTKSAVQLGVAFTSKENLAGHMPCATPPAPSEMAQSFFMGPLVCLRGIGLGRLAACAPGLNLPSHSHAEATGHRPAARSTSSPPVPACSRR